MGGRMLLTLLSLVPVVLGVATILVTAGRALQFCETGQACTDDIVFLIIAIGIVIIGLVLVGASMRFRGRAAALRDLEQAGLRHDHI